MKLSSPVVVLGGFLLLIAALLAVASFASSLRGGCVGVISVDGDISFSSTDFLGVAGESSFSRISGALKKAEEQDEVKAVLLEVNSGGGDAAASKDLFDLFNASKKPVVAYFKEIAASGAYYVASPSDWIVANPNSITGSIGARMELLNYEELLRKIGARQESVQSGGLKDMGAGYRNLTGEERMLLSEMINETADNFKKDVMEARGSKVSNPFFRQAMDARVLSASQALKAGLIDEIGGRRKALEKAAGFGGIGEQRECSFEEQQSWLGGLLGGFGASIGKGVVSALRQEQGFALKYS